MKLTKAYLKQLIKEELNESMMDPKNVILGAFEGVPPERMVIALNAIADLGLSNQELKQIAVDLSYERTASGDGSVMMDTYEDDPVYSDTHRAHMG